MNIFIMRHGEAEMFGQSDQARHLTQQGIKQAQKQGQWLQDIEFNKIIISPYTRAVETFDQINTIFNHQLTPLVEQWQGITPYGDPSIVYEYLTVLAEQNMQNILIISHLPLVEDIVDVVCDHRNKISFYPATIAKVDFNEKKLLEIQPPF